MRASVDRKIFGIICKYKMKNKALNEIAHKNEQLMIDGMWMNSNCHV
jgi:hypothetical protein